MKKILIAGGGTGGHIYPALTIAKEIKCLYPEYEVEFVGTPDGLESKLIPKAGFKISFVSVGKLNYQGQWLAKLKTIFRLPWSLIKSISIVIEKKPVLVLGVGGYASGPFVLASALMGVPTALWEPNAQPGLTNRWLARFVRKTFVVFAKSLELLKAKRSEVVGMPVRTEIENLGHSTKIYKNDNERKFRVLVFGGSQGARPINNCVSEMIIKNRPTDVEFVHQTGQLDYQRILKSYEQMQNVKCLEYLYDIEKYYSWADLIICRAGASTLAELSAAKKPSILIPLPTAADDHQTKNALTLVEKEAGFLIKQGELNPDFLFSKIKNLQMHPEILENMSRNIAQFYKPKAASEIATKFFNIQYDSGE